MVQRQCLDPAIKGNSKREASWPESEKKKEEEKRKKKHAHNYFHLACRLRVAL